MSGQQTVFGSGPGGLLKLTDITQDGTNEGGLNDPELALDERDNLRNRLSHRGRTVTVI